MCLAPDCILKIFDFILELFIKFDIVIGIIKISTESKLWSFFLLMQFLLCELQLLSEKDVLFFDLFLFISWKLNHFFKLYYFIFISNYSILSFIGLVLVHCDDSILLCFADLYFFLQFQNLLL